MRFEILMSCMEQIDFELAEQSHVKSNLLILNQTNNNNSSIREIAGKQQRLLNSTTRGLSVSRNLALNNAQGDICLLADNDEIFRDDCEEKILRAFEKLPDASVIAFKVKNSNKQLPEKVCRVGKLCSMRLASWQLAFRKNRILENGIRFDEKLGAGTYYGSGEENKFLFDCLKKGLKIYYVPEEIAELVERGESTWFKGYDQEFFLKKGAVTRYYMGAFLSYIYGLYFCYTKRKLYQQEVPVREAWKCWRKAWKENKV